MWITTSGLPACMAAVRPAASKTSTMAASAPAAVIVAAPASVRDVPVTRKPAATSMAVSGRPIAPLAPARKMRVVTAVAYRGPDDSALAGVHASTILGKIGVSTRRNGARPMGQAAPASPLPPPPHEHNSVATWQWAYRTLPAYLLTHSVRAYCWGAAIADVEVWAFDRPILWAASLMHDVGLTRLARNTMCFEVEGAEIARRFLEREGMAAEAIDRAAIAIVLHMRPSVTLDDGVESVLLDRATGLDVRGAEYTLVDAVRADVMRAFPRGAFDRHFLAATGKAPLRYSAHALQRLSERGTGLAEWMATSPWALEAGAARVESAEHERDDRGR